MPVGRTSYRYILIAGFIMGLLFPLEGQTYLSKPVHFHADGIRIADVLDSISIRLHVNFSYDASRIIHDDMIRESFQGEPLVDVLKKLFRGQNVGFIERGNQIALFPIQQEPVVNHKIEAVVEINGRITDRKSRQGIPFASISLGNSSAGTISNGDGYFSFRIPLGRIDSVLLISCIGYESVTLPFDSTFWVFREIRLTPVRIDLPAVIIRPEKPEELIRLAMKSVGANYESHPVFLTGYFREITWENQRCMAFSESVIDIYKSAYNNPLDNDQIRLFKGRKQQDVIETSRLDYKVEGGLYNSLLLDIARNPIGFLEEGSFAFYDFYFDGFTKLNGRDVYIIRFDQKPLTQDALFAGRLYIDVESMAIAGAKFGLSEQGIKYARTLLIRKSPHSYQVRPLKAEYNVSYRFVKGKWTLSSVHTELDVRAKARRAFFNSVYKTFSDLVITGKDTSNVRRFKGSEVARSTDILVNQIKDYDPVFWEGFNTIQPESRLEDAVEKLLQKIKNDIQYSQPDSLVHEGL